MKFELVFGFHPIKQILISHPKKILEILIVEDRKDQRVSEILFLAKDNKINVKFISKRELEALTTDTHHQGIAARVSPTETLPFSSLVDRIKNQQLKNPLLLVLDGIQDPHNLGACLRTADACGVSAVIIPKDKAASLSPTVRKVASGAVENVPIIEVTNIARTIEELKDLGVWIIGLSDKGEKTLYEMNLQGPMAFVLGREGEGLRRLTEEKCDWLVKIPMLGVVSSLNVSVATGVCLYEALRQRL